ncbi:MAG: MxaK protein [Gammaproteobacteria bacterium]
MTRQTIHLLFGVAALGFSLAAAYQGWRLHQARQVNAAIASADAASLDSTVAEARFARALALAKAGDAEAALQAYKALIDGERADLRLAALYNLGNLHLREALKNGPEQAVKSLPLIELAKQRYRDLLRGDPTDWDARYNLERALWLAPEVEDPIIEDNQPPIPKERSVSTLSGARIDLP